MSTPNSAIQARPSVLVATADRRLFQFLTQILDSWRYCVDPATTGAEALARLEDPNPPSIALLDMSLSGPTATEIVLRVGASPDERRTWTVLMSADPLPQGLHAAASAGCDDFFRIPAQPAELKLRMRIAERMRVLTGQLQKQSAELRFQSTHDGLTGLWNREALLSLVFQETDRAQRMKTPLSLMLLDLDEFSRINQDFGFQAGDRILTALGNRFRRHLRSYDLIGRCGEDEFLLALPGCTSDSALALATRIRDTILAQPFPVQDESVALTASFGIAVSRGRSPIVVLREAERALAEAKLAGRNCSRLAAAADPPSPESLLVGVSLLPARKAV